MDYSTFQIGFWHPFGPHSNEPPEKILARKAKEIEDNGWTLWSFQYRRMLEEWYRQLTIAAAGKVFVFCSCGSGRDPLARGGTAQAVDCQSYRFVGQGEWRPIPERIRVPHTLPSGKGLASAFLVQRLIHPVQRSVLPIVEWFSREGRWRQGFQVGE